MRGSSGWLAGHHHRASPRATLYGDCPSRAEAGSPSPCGSASPQLLADQLSPVANEEGGRGLFICAKLARRRGVRFMDGGKTIWTEQELPTTSSAA